MTMPNRSLFEFRPVVGREGGDLPVVIHIYEVRPDGFERVVGFYSRMSQEAKAFFLGPVFLKAAP